MKDRIPVTSNNGTFVKWAEVSKGAEFEGVFRGMREGKFGLLADLETADGALTLPLPTALERQLGRVKVGAAVVIVYRGKATSEKTGKDYHSFETFVSETSARVAPPRRSPAPAVDPDEVPF